MVVLLLTSGSARAQVSTGGHGGGQETTVINSISTLVHHGIIFVPLGYSTVFGQLANLTEVHGGKHLTPDLSSPCIVSLHL